MSGYKFLTVPGWKGSGPEHWQSIWEGRKPGFTRVNQSIWDLPERDQWAATLGRHIKGADAPVILVAHSLGCLTVAYWAQTASRDCGVAAALLVAPPWFEKVESCPVELRSFLPIATQRLPFVSLLVASHDDPYISWPVAQQLGRQWGSRVANAGKAGHINVDSGHGEWPEGEQLLNDLVNETGRVSI